MYPRAKQFPQPITLTTKTSVHPNLVVPPHSGEKLMVWFGWFDGMYVSFIGLRLTKTSQSLSIAPGFEPKANPPVTLKPKLKSLPIL